VQQVVFILQFEGGSGITEELLSNEQASLRDWCLSRIESIAGIPHVQHFQPVDHGRMLFPCRVLEVISCLFPPATRASKTKHLAAQVLCHILTAEFDECSSVHVPYPNHFEVTLRNKTTSIRSPKDH